jgi:hypothetical protein
MSLIPWLDRPIEAPVVSRRLAGVSASQPAVLHGVREKSTAT